MEHVKREVRPADSGFGQQVDGSRTRPAGSAGGRPTPIILGGGPYCEAVTKQGNRCKAYHVGGSPFCIGHQRAADA